MPTTVEKIEEHLQAVHQLCADAWLDVLGADREAVRGIAEELNEVLDAIRLWVNARLLAEEQADSDSS